MRSLSWMWEKVDVSRSGAAGDLSKMFKNEGVDEPGVFARNAPPADATLLAREVIQNSWDAARELKDERSRLGQDVDFSIEFRFKEFRGAQKRDFAAAAGLDELAERVDAVGPGQAGESARARLGLSREDCLDQLDDDTPLRILEIHESGTTGMYGPFVDTKSKLYLALVSIGFTAKAQGSGGSYGYGKAGLIRGSGTHSVLAYTCFEGREDDPGVTRRLLGMAYWGRHEIGDLSYTGFGRFGVDRGGSTVPFENGEADAVANSLGMDTRSASSLEELGSSFVLIDPTVDPASLKVAIERNWWPALNDHDFSVEIHTADGDVLIPRPKSDDLLRPFIRGYELARVAQDSDLEGEYSKGFQRVSLSNGDPVDIGRLGLVADVKGWSYPVRESSDGGEDAVVRHRSLVALVRGPKMVVQYLEAGQAMPFVRGTFVAGPEVDDLLRQTEPKAHDSWQAKVDTDGMDPDAPVVADKVVRGIKRRVREFRDLLKPPTPDRRDIRLPVLEQLFRQVLDGEGTRMTGPEATPRLVSISLDQDLERVEGPTSEIRLTGRARIALSKHHPTGSGPVDVRIRYVIVEEGGPGTPCEIEISPPSEFDAIDLEKGWFRGELDTEEVEFRFRTVPYAADWSGKLAVTADPIAQTAEPTESVTS